MVAEKESSSGRREELAHAVSPTISSAICFDLAEQLQIIRTTSILTLSWSQRM